MTDISTIWDSANNRGDWALLASRADLLSGNDLISALLISIFTDRIAGPDDVIPDGTSNRRGWWADDPQYPIGSRLWLLQRVAATDDIPARAKTYIQEAVQWFLDDDVVARFDIVTEWTMPGMLGGSVMAYKADGSKVALSFTWAWTLTFGTPIGSLPSGGSTTADSITVTVDSTTITVDRG